MQFKNLLLSVTALASIVAAAPIAAAEGSTSANSPVGFVATSGSDPTFYLQFKEGTISGPAKVDVEGEVYSTVNNKLTIKNFSASKVSGDEISKTHSTTAFSGEWHVDNNDDTFSFLVSTANSGSSTSGSKTVFKGSYTLDSDGEQHNFTVPVNAN